MTLTLKRSSREHSGVFGTLISEDEAFSCVTLEHAYPVFDNNFTSKIPAGQYTCVRGLHRLEGMTYSFETFEITCVPGHTDILFHWGNFNTDSAGCVLLGSNVIVESYNGPKMITNSKETFQKFISFLNGIDQFNLTVS